MTNRRVWSAALVVLSGALFALPSRGQDGTGALPAPAPQATTVPPDGIVATDPGTPLISLLPEKDAEGNPLFFYGRVKTVTKGQDQILDAFSFPHESQPFFDEYDPKKASQSTGWQYSIASAAQWNLLLKYPKFAAAVEINPLAPRIPHPVFESFIAGQPFQSLNAQMLADIGFQLPKLRFHQKAACRRTAGGPPGVTTLNLWDDFVDLVGDVGNAALQLIDEVAKGTPGAIGQLIAYAEQGVSEALDFLSKLANGGVCLLTGKGNHSGRVYVLDKMTGQQIARPWVAGSPHEPIRGGSIHARALGILLTEADIDGDGYYNLDSLCKHIDTYEANVVLDNYAATIHTGADETPQAVWYASFSPDGGYTEDVIVPTQFGGAADHRNATLYIAAQLGHAFAEEAYGFSPGTQDVEIGPIGAFVGAINGRPATTSCGQLALISTVESFIAGDPFLLKEVNADTVYAGPKADSNPTTLGLGLHEYGHFVVCQAIQHFSGKWDLEKYLLAQEAHILTKDIPGGADYTDDLQNSAESIADLFVFRAMGYTNYFTNNGSNSFCPGPPFQCLDPDMSTPYQDPSVFPYLLMQSRAGVMYDWVTPPPPVGGGLHLGLPQDALPKSFANVGSQVITQNLSNWIAHEAAYGNPLEGLCTIYELHGWPCPDFQLDAPQNFDGVATAVNKIRWSWTDVALADSYALQALNGTNKKWEDAASPVPAGTLTVEQTVAGGPNTRVTAHVEARRFAVGGAKPADSMPQLRCTLAAPVNTLTVALAPAGPTLTWKSNNSSSYAVVRTEAGAGSGVGDEVITTINTSAGAPPVLTYVDTSAVAGKTYLYRIDSQNCNGVPTTGIPALGFIEVPCPPDPSAIYVRLGGSGGTSDGSKAAPFSSFEDAVQALTPTRNKILASAGIFPNFVDIPAGVSSVYIAGGYEPSFATCARVGTTVISGTPADRLIITSSSAEMGIIASVRPVLSSMHGAAIHLDSLTIDPSQRSCGAGCFRLTAAYVLGSLSVDDVKVLTAFSVGTVGNLVGPQSQLDVVAPVNGGPAAGALSVSNSLLSGVTASGVDDVCPDKECGDTLASGRAVNVSGSRILGTGTACVVAGASGTISKSFIRGSSNGWMPAGSCGADYFDVTVTNSIIAAGVPVFVGHVATVADSLLYGNSTTASGVFVNDILFADSGVPLTFKLTCPLGGMSCELQLANAVKGNMFIVPGAPGSDPLVGASDFKPMVSKSGVNSGKAWFGIDHPGIGANQVFLTPSDIQYLFHQDPGTGAYDVVPTLPSALAGPGLPFHPGHFYIGGAGGSIASFYTNGVDPTEFVPAISDDIENHFRSTAAPFGPGPYWGVDLGKP